MSWMNLNDATSEHIAQAEAGLQAINRYVDHLVLTLKEHKIKHNMACVTYCPGDHFIQDLAAFMTGGIDLSQDPGELSEDELREYAEVSQSTIQGIITVMATRLAGYDTD